MEENVKTYITNNSYETMKIGEDIAKALKGGEVLALYGDLGSGKTTFVQGLAKGLEIKTRIISPTFIIVRQYKVGFKNFYHIDLYRLEDLKQIEGLGIKEILNDSENIVAVEWPERIKDLLPRKRYEIRFEVIDENKRKILVKKL